uniref:DJ-1/PfpI domain-containing protein n=1 Tax=Aegilops tauschii TaxID=37682 RepID=R7W895_AEGTA
MSFACIKEQLQFSMKPYANRCKGFNYRIINPNIHNPYDQILLNYIATNSHHATGHPWFVEKFPPKVTAVDANVVVDGNAVTGTGPATSMEFAMALVEQLYGKEKVEQIAKPMLVRYEGGYSMKELNSVEWHCSGTPKVLLPVANGIEEMEAIILVDALRRANADVVVASAEDGVVVTARYGTRIVADVMADCVAGPPPGGMPGAKTLGGCEQLVALLKKQAEANTARSAPPPPTCSSPMACSRYVLSYPGKKATTCASMAGLLADGGECENRVVVDGNVITSRSPGTAMEYAAAVVEKMMGRDEARRLAEGLLFLS